MMSTSHQTCAIHSKHWQTCSSAVNTSRPGNAFVHMSVSIISSRGQILTAAFQLLLCSSVVCSFNVLYRMSFLDRLDRHLMLGIS